MTTIKGVTVARANVPAMGHKLETGEQIYTDQETLVTMLAAATAIGGVVRCREDHTDTLAARVGSVGGFRIEGDRLLADIDILDSYGRKEMIVELAEKTPELFGLSAYFKAEYKLIDGKAYARIQSLHAVDVVDRGAVTPTGLFSAQLNQEPTKEISMTPEEITQLIQSEITKALAPVIEKMASMYPEAKAEEVTKETKEEVAKLRADVSALGVKFSAKPQEETVKEKSVVEKYNDLTGRDRAQFYAKHKNEIWAAQTAK